MRRTSRLARLGHQAIAGAALAALLAWVPFGAAAHAPAYADEPQAWAAAEESLATGEGASEDQVTFDAVSPVEAAFDVTEDVAFSGDADAGAYDESASLASDEDEPLFDDVPAAGADASLILADDVPVTEDGAIAYSDDAPSATEGDTYLPDATDADAPADIADAACLGEDEGIEALASSSVTYDSILKIRGNKSYTLAWQVLTLVNQERAKEGLSALTMDSSLLSAAMLRGGEIAVCFSHTRPTGQTCFTACAKMTGENIAYGYRSAEDVMNGWMNSSGHRANIMNKSFKSIGISCVQVNGSYYWVQCFSTTAATTTSKPADVSNALMSVAYTKDGLTSLNTTFSICPVKSDGTTIDIDGSGSLLVGSSRRYGLFVGNTPIDNSCVTWSISSTVAKLGTPTATVTATGVGSFTLTASVGGGTVKQTLTRTTALPVYTVSFYSNGGSAVTSQSVTSGQKATKPTNPTKAGYTFTGWYSDSALTKAYNFSTAVKSNLTLYAGWKQITYTVSFNSNGGSAVASQTVTWYSQAKKPTNPTKAGYTFTGWYSDSALTTAYNFSNSVKSNMTLYAGWKQITYTVSFNSNGGSSTASQTVAWGSTATRPANPTKAGYTFKGWYSDSALTKAYDFATPVKSYLVLYAGWKQITYTVSFNSNGGSAVASQTVAWGSTATKPASPTKAGYTFTGWYSNSVLTTAYNFSTAVKSNLILYAGWKQITYTVSFNSNGGSSTASQTVAWGSTATRPANPTKAGYTFKGWYSDSALTKAYDFATPVKSYLVLYAGWKQITYTVSFNSNGGSAVSSQTVIWNRTAYRPTTPTKDGHTFTGWYSDSALTKAYDFSTAVTGNMTLYAGWKQITYTVTFIINGWYNTAEQTVTWGSKVVKPADPTREGYTFTGWYSDSALTKAYDFATPVKTYLLLYAGWDQATYVVSFDTSGGSAVSSQTVTWGYRAAKPADPTRDGYTFTGWYSDKARTQAYSFYSAVKSNLTLYAGWKQITYTVTFERNGGSSTASQTVAWGAKATKPADPVKSEFAFTGWYSDKALTKAYDFGTAVKSNLTLYAGWKQVIFTMSFNSQGGSAVANQKVALGSAATRPADPVKAGCTFTGWYTDTSFKTLYDFGKPVQYNTLLQAGWKQIACTITFNTNGGSSVASQTVAGGEKAVKPANPTKAGYTFAGWYYNKALTVAYDFGTAVESDLTLYAAWREDPAALTYKDVPAGKWYTYWVAEATEAGLMSGHKGADGKYTGYFEPNGIITRAQVATVLWRIAGSPSAPASTFPDMSGHWASAAVAWCNAKGVVTGYTGGPDAGKFVPDRQVSRQELAVMVWRFAKWAGVNTANPSTVAFYYCSDAALVPAWSREAMTWCASAGIITGIQGNGRPTLSPEAGATRAMAAKIFVHTQWHCTKATGSQSDEGAGDKATQESLDQATFEDVQADAPGNSSLTGTDETFDAVEPGKAAQAGETTDASANKPEQAEESEGADAPDESPDASADTADTGEEPDDGELAPADGDDAVEAPDASATGTPDDIAEPAAEPAEAGEEPSDSEADAASATDVADVTETPAGPAEAATFDAPDAIAA